MEGSSELFAGTTGCLELAREYLDGFGVPFEVVGGNHDLEGIDEFPTDESNMEAYLRILGKPTPQFIREVLKNYIIIQYFFGGLYNLICHKKMCMLTSTGDKLSLFIRTYVS